MKRMIALLPCLEGAGGIRVLLDLFQGIQKMGYQINVWSQLEGSFRQKFEEMGINVQIQKNMLDETFTLNVKDDEDIFVNTLQMFPVIKKEIIIWSIMQSTSSVCLIIRKSCVQAQHRQSTMPYIREK